MNTPDQNKTEQQKKDFPGYPAYPASDDITNQADIDDNGVPGNADNNSLAGEASEQRMTAAPKARNGNENIDPDVDVTAEDIAMLTASDQSRDMDDPDIEETLLDTTDDDGDPLNEPTGSYGNAGADLDVPGSESDDANEAIGEEDEENNYYSLGGDNHENLEDNTSV